MSTSPPPQPAPKDHWSSTAYQASASFVPHLTTKIITWLDPQPSDSILDIGCGDGTLTTQISQRCHSILGLDSSASMINAAISNSPTPSHHLHHNPSSFEICDCTQLDTALQERSLHGAFDKVFSNAALHWILRAPATRTGVLKGAYDALKPNGTFVFEMGAAGNVAEVQTALLAALVAQGVNIERAREMSPWFFPSEEMMGRMLREVGFVVERAEVEYRPTRLTEEGGLEGWVRLFGAEMMEGLNGESRERAVKLTRDLLEGVVGREGGEGGQWLGYVRLRVLARRPE